MAKRRWRIVAVLSTLLSLTVLFSLVLWVIPAAGQQAGNIQVEMTSGRNLNSIAYNVVLKNPTSATVGNIFVSAMVPKGTEYVAKSATYGGTLQGSQVVWLVDKVPAKGQVVLAYKASAKAPEVGGSHAWVRWLSPSEGTALSKVVAAEYQLIDVKGVNTRFDHEKYPDGKIALTTTSGKGHGEDEIITSGLTNVGVGEYVILEGAKHDNLENEIVSWSWQVLDRPLGSKASLDTSAGQETRFIADHWGDYLVQLTATNAKGQSASSSINITTGTYAGISLCASCHDGSVPGAKDIMSSFVKTGHADKFETTWASYSATSDYCIRCHTLGYNEQANNGGMDDAARASGWSSKLGSLIAWLKNTGWTLEQVKADPNMSRTINISCENCHGPGATAHTGVKSMAPSTCAQCHPQPKQWEFAGHAKVDAHMATNSSCARCHTGEGYVVEWVRGGKAVMPDQATPEMPANILPIEQQSGISCATCHDPHAFTDSHVGKYGPASNQLRIVGEVTAPMGWKVNADLAATCVRCHANNRTSKNQADFLAGAYVRATHENTQADVFYGKGFYDYGGAIVTSNSFHTTLKEACITCHMAANPVVDGAKALSVGGHSWNMEGEWEGKTIENIGACTTCHAGATTFNRPAAGDYDGDSKIEGVQDEVKGLLALLAGQLPKDPATGAVLASSISNANTNEPQRKAMWNYFLILRDGSNGVHNTSFAVQLLQKTYKQLAGKDVPGAALR